MKKTGPDALRAAMFAEMQSGEILERALSYGREYVAAVHDRRVFPGERARAGLEAFEEALPDGPGCVARTSVRCVMRPGRR